MFITSFTSRCLSKSATGFSTLYFAVFPGIWELQSRRKRIVTGNQESEGNTSLNPSEGNRVARYVSALEISRCIASRVTQVGLACERPYILCSDKHFDWAPLAPAPPGLLGTRVQANMQSAAVQVAQVGSIQEQKDTFRMEHQLRPLDQLKSQKPQSAPLRFQRRCRDKLLPASNQHCQTDGTDAQFGEMSLTRPTSQLLPPLMSPL